MKLRQLPEDFRVEEINSFKISKDKLPFKLYLLEKKSLESFSLLGYLSKINNIPLKDIGIAGLKDKHAITKQYITVPSKYDLKTVHEKNFKITYLGYVDRGLELGDLQGNRFEITVRDIKKGELDGTYQKAKSIQESGVPNYFDSQRFGSVINGQFIAKELIKKNYERAVKSYLTSFSKHESSSVKNDKRAILNHWQNLKGLRLNNRNLAEIIETYNRTNNWLEAYKRIPVRIREIIVSAYQSYLWNECVKELLKSAVDKRRLYSIKYNIGSLLFYKRLEQHEAAKIPLTFKTISDELKADESEKDIINKVLSREGIEIKEMRIKEKTSNFFKTHEREVIVRPSEFNISDYLIDEQNDHGKRNSFKITLSFILPKGSYATVITKKLFNR